MATLVERLDRGRRLPGTSRATPAPSAEFHFFCDPARRASGAPLRRADHAVAAGRDAQTPVLPHRTSATSGQRRIADRRLSFGRSCRTASPERRACTASRASICKTFSALSLWSMPGASDDPIRGRRCGAARRTDTRHERFRRAAGAATAKPNVELATGVDVLGRAPVHPAHSQRRIAANLALQL